MYGKRLRGKQARVVNMRLARGRHRGMRIAHAYVLYCILYFVSLFVRFSVCLLSGETLVCTPILAYIPVGSNTFCDKYRNAVKNIENTVTAKT